MEIYFLKKYFLFNALSLFSYNSLNLNFNIFKVWFLVDVFYYTILSVLEIVHSFPARGVLSREKLHFRKFSYFTSICHDHDSWGGNRKYLT